MEGVLVSAKRDGSNITTTVVTNEQGRLQLSGRPAGARTLHAVDPRRRLQAGRAESGRRCGRRTRPPPTSRSARSTALANQLSNGEWLNSLPGDDKLKAALTNCVGCHTLQRIVQSTHNADEFMQVFQRMGTYAPGSTPTFPQPLLPGGNNSNRSPMPGPSSRRWRTISPA